MVNPHAHHAAYKYGIGPEQQAVVSEIQEMLVKDFGIDPIKGKEVLCWAPNIAGQHNLDDMIELRDDLKEVKKNKKGYDGAVEALNKQKEKAAKVGQVKESDESKCDT